MKLLDYHSPERPLCPQTNTTSFDLLDASADLIRIPYELHQLSMRDLNNIRYGDIYNLPLPMEVSELPDHEHFFLSDPSAKIKTLYFEGMILPGQRLVSIPHGAFEPYDGTLSEYKGPIPPLVDIFTVIARHADCVIANNQHAENSISSWSLKYEAGEWPKHYFAQTLHMHNIDQYGEIGVPCSMYLATQRDEKGTEVVSNKAAIEIFRESGLSWILEQPITERILPEELNRDVYDLKSKFRRACKRLAGGKLHMLNNFQYHGWPAMTPAGRPYLAAFMKLQR